VVNLEPQAARLKTALMAVYREQRLSSDHHAAARKVGIGESQGREVRWSGSGSGLGRESSNETVTCARGMEQSTVRVGKSWSKRVATVKF